MRGRRCWVAGTEHVHLLQPRPPAAGARARGHPPATPDVPSSPAPSFSGGSLLVAAAARLAHVELARRPHSEELTFRPPTPRRRRAAAPGTRAGRGSASAAGAAGAAGRSWSCCGRRSSSGATTPCSSACARCRSRPARSRRTRVCATCASCSDVCFAFATCCNASVVAILLLGLRAEKTGQGLIGAQGHVAPSAMSPVTQ